jgi:NADPH-dependent 2,4-dienoyl-CoA reductase/sulfur reductase-like enzyme
MTKLSRRAFLAALAAGAASLALPARAAQGTVVVVGGGYAGLTFARYLKRWAPSVRVVVIEPAGQFVSCPMSNRVIYGTLSMHDITRDYAILEGSGIEHVRDRVTAVDAARRQVRLASGASLGYDRLVLAPGVEFRFADIPGLAPGEADKVLHAWKAGPQTVELRQRLHALPDGSVAAIYIPKVPYRCPPGPYERATLIADHFALFKPKSKLLVFDANADVQSKRELFRGEWDRRFKGMLEYLPNAELKRVDLVKNEVDMGVQGRHRVDLINLIPPQQAPAFALTACGEKPEARWCAVDFLSYESKNVPNVHVIGDAILGAPGMPKSGHMANQEAKVAAAAIARLLAGQPVDAAPIIANTCYSFVSRREAMHVTGVFRYDAEKKTMVAVKEAGGTSEAASAHEGFLAMAWFFNIMNDLFA